jgi:hypothetical protein
MTIESPATYISQLNSSYPEGSADRSEADNHLRLIKATVLASFPGITGAMTATHTELNLNVGNTRTIGSRLVQYSLSISAVKSSISAILTDTTKFSLSISAINTRVNTLSVTVAALQTDVARISLSISAIITDTTKFSLSISAINTRVNTLSVSVATVQTDVARISQTVSVAIAKIAAYSLSISAINTVLSTVVSSTYTPTITNKLNIASVDSVAVSQYTRIGDQVTVYGRFAATATAPGATQVYIGLPVASDIADATSLIGVGYADSYVSCPVLGDPTGDRAIILGNVAAGSQNYLYSFSYRVV